MERGFTLVEVLISLVILLLVASTALSLMSSHATATLAQPDVMDQQQRARMAADALTRDLLLAGAGVDSGPATGALSNYFAPVIPRRMGFQQADAYTVARHDAITLTYVPKTYHQTTLTDPMPGASSTLKVASLPNCPPGNVCGLDAGMTALIFNDLGHFDVVTVTDAQPTGGLVQHRQQSDLSFSYQPGAVVTQAESHTYYFDGANKQLRHYDGDQTDVPVIDGVVSVQFEYFGDPQPPGAPKPPLGVANCLYDVAGTFRSGLATLAPQGGSLAALPLSMLNDGPWCGAGSNRFDADLLRVRKLRVTLRVQTTNDMLRGTTADFSQSGKSRSALTQVPDYFLRFEVSPRNLNLGR